MATDVYVMPLWRYKAGDFSTPLETHFGASTIVATPSGVYLRERLNVLRWWNRRSSKRQARAEMRAASEKVGRELTWLDEAAVAYSNQFRAGSTILAYLWWLDRRDLLGEPYREPEPGRPEEYTAFWSTARDRPPSFPHLQLHNYHWGYFIPVDFGPVEIQLEKQFSGRWMGKPVCSTPRALSEIETIAGVLGIPEQYSMSVPTQALGAMPRTAERLSFDHLRTVLRLSQQHSLPVIFWG